MSNFKRNSSSFGRSGLSSNASSGGQSNLASSSGGGYASRNVRDDRGSSRGGRSGGGVDSKFTRLGNLTVPKSVDDDTRDAIMNELRGNEAIKLISKVYLPKGVQEVVLRNGDTLLVNFRVNERDKDFVVGGISKAND